MSQIQLVSVELALRKVNTRVNPSGQKMYRYRVDSDLQDWQLDNPNAPSAMGM